jgi:hypothetical protein
MPPKTVPDVYFCTKTGGNAIMMSENTAVVVAETATRLPEMALKSVELAKMLFEIMMKIAKADVKSYNFLHSLTAAGKIAKAAEQSGTGIMQKSGIPREHMQTLGRVCEELGIPVVFKKNRNSESVTAVYAGNYTDAFLNAMKETVARSLAENPQDYTAFKISENEIPGISGMCEKNGVDTSFARLDGGQIICVHQKKHRKSIEMIKSEYKKACEDVAENFERGFDAETKKYVFTDLSGGKSVKVSLPRLPTHSELSVQNVVDQR